MKLLFQHLGVLSKAQLDQPGNAWPWLLAARVLASKTGSNPAVLLTWPELWDVLRWYAHNRGYDGNRRWSAAESAEAAEDTEKEENARNLMGKHGTKSMAETFCAELKVDPFGKKKSSMVRFKGLNAAFPREVVEKEVRQILQAHFGKLAGVDAMLEKMLLDDWQALPCPAIKLPKRFQGGLLFGQLVPRFDNRIISKCPITGEKVPSRDCPEFLKFRWAMLLANVQVVRFGEKELSPLTAGERKQLDTLMRQEGAMGAGEFKDHVRKISGAIRDNLETMFMHPDSKDALLLDPVQKLIQSNDLKTIWPLLPARIQKRTVGKLRRGKTITLGSLRKQIIELNEPVAAFDAECQKQLDVTNTRGKKKDKQLTLEQLLNVPLSVKKLGQRAAYARSILAKTYEDVMAGKPHPKEEGGCLFVTEAMRQAQLNREIADQTNNHLIRHRLLILQRLVNDIVKEYAQGDKEHIGKVTIEVNRDLREMSGKTAKEKAQDLGLRIANHHRVAEKIMEAFANTQTRITAGLIRKARIADDLGWACPYTGQKFEPVDLVTRRVDKDHIVPRSDRPSDSLDSLVITFSAVNNWKGKRTAYRFIEEEQGKPVPDLPNLSILSLSRYRQFVESLESYKGHDDDKRRKERRKKLMLLPSYEEKEFVPRDLTQTSQLVRLGAQAIKKLFQDTKNPVHVISLPGSVTGAIRKAWNVLGCLSLACPQVLDENGKVKIKTEIRDITHLHHALDACVLGLASHFIPNNGRVWELIVKRNPTDTEKRELMALGVFGVDSEGRFQMRDLDGQLKDQIRQRLGEKRVVQHLPSRMYGLRVEQNTWRVVSIKDGEVTLKQRVRHPDGSRPEKTAQERNVKLLGLSPAQGNGKLKKNKGVLVIPDNFGVALDPEPTIIPFHKVWSRLEELKAANNGKRPRVLRNGQIINITAGKNFRGIWRVFSAKNNSTGLALDIGSPDVVRLKNKTEGHKINVRLATLLKDGLQIVRTPLTGIAATSATSAS